MATWSTTICYFTFNTCSQEEYNRIKNAIGHKNKLMSSAPLMQIARNFHTMGWGGNVGQM